MPNPGMNPATDSAPRKLRIGPRAGVLLTLLALVLFELGLRAAGYPDQVATRTDPDVGWVLLPNQDVDFDGVPVRINARGFRDADWPPGGSRATKRVAILGDSVPYGTGIGAERRLTEALARHLTRELGPGEAEVRNFAIPGYGFQQMRALFDRTVRTWDPDVVVVALNDASHRPLVVPARGGWVRRLLIRTATYQWWLSVSNFEVRDPMEPDEDVQRVERERAEQIKHDPFAAEYLDGWESVLAGLVQLQAIQAERGGRLIVLALPRIRHIANPSLPYVGAHLATRLQAAQLQLVDPLPRFRATMGPLFETLRKSGYETRALWSHETSAALEWTPELKSLAEGANLFQVGDPDHWTALAHELAGRALAEALLEDR